MHSSCSFPFRGKGEGGMGDGGWGLDVYAAVFNGSRLNCPTPTLPRKGREQFQCDSARVEYKLSQYKFLQPASRLTRRAARLAPATAERLIQRDLRLQLRQPGLHDLLARGKQRALRIKQIKVA